MAKILEFKPKELTPKQKEDYQKMIESLKMGNVYSANKIRNSLPKEIINNPEVQEAAKEGLIVTLKNFIRTDFSREKLKPNVGMLRYHPEVKKAIEAGLFKKTVVAGFNPPYVEDISRYVTEFKLSEKITLSPEIQDLAEKVQIKLVENDLIQDAIDLQYQIPFLKGTSEIPELQKSIEKALAKAVEIDDKETIRKIVEGFALKVEGKAAEVYKEAKEAQDKEIKEGQEMTKKLFPNLNIK